MARPYTVTLQEAGLPTRERIEAEVRFARELESVLGGAQYVVETFRAWVEVSESEAKQIDRNTAMIAAHWPVALNAATRAGFHNLGELGEARFEVRLERHAA